MTDIYIEAQNLTFRYDEENNDTLDNVLLNVKKGEFVVILGPNGCGKSTLARHFNAMLLPVLGHVFVSGTDTLSCKNLYDIRQKVGLVLQNPDNQIIASVVSEDVAFGPENLGIKPKEIVRRVDNALKTVGMYELRNGLTYELSGGQKQRIAIAGILAMQPECIVLDEPTAMLDPEGRREVLETIRKLNKEKGITVILITHYMSEAIDADNIFVMDEGKVVLSGEPRDVFSNIKVLEEHGLYVPQVTEFVSRLNEQGLKLPQGVITEEECVAEILEFLEEKGCLS